INEVLSSLDVKFIVSAEGIHEGVTMSVFVSFIPNSSKTGLVPMTQPYTDFFKLLRLFICQPEEFVKIKGGKKDPIAQLLKTIVPLNLGKNGRCAIVSPSPENTSPSYEAIHVFKEMNCEQMIQPLLYNFIYLNARFHKQTFIITKLTNSLYLSSGLPYAKENV